MAGAAPSAGWGEPAKWGWAWENQLDRKRTAGVEGVTLSRKAGFTKHTTHNDYSARVIPLGLCPAESLPAPLPPGKGAAGSRPWLRNNSHSLALVTLLTEGLPGAESVLAASKAGLLCGEEVGAGEPKADHPKVSARP